MTYTLAILFSLISHIIWVINKGVPWFAISKNRDPRMGWSFRKAFNIGPFRVNVSKSGVGYSVGGGGFRTGVRSNGASYQSASIPGTGLRYTSSGGTKGKSSGCSSCLGCLIWIIAGFLLLACLLPKVPK